MNKTCLYMLIFSIFFWNCARTDTHEGHNHSQEENVHSEGNVIEDHDHSAEENILEDKNHEAEYCENDSIYEIIELVPSEFSEIIHTSGEILSARGDEITITAIHDGLIILNDNQLLPGRKVSDKELLFTISGKELVHDNIETSFLDSKNNFETTKVNYERALKLNEDKIVSDKELSEARLEFEKANNNYDIVKRNYTSGGQKIYSSSDGYVKEVFVNEGEFVNTGQPLLKLTKNKRLVIKADVSQQYFTRLKEIRTANFITVYDKTLYSIEDLNGKLLSYGKTTAENSLFTPVYFEIDNIGNLLPGSFIEVYLKTQPFQNVLKVPLGALLEEAGKYYVYIEEDEKFIKKYVENSMSDGEYAMIKSGLKPGDLVVTKNAYQIKLSSLSGALPAHSHQH
jgi:RND family efflux transporter MFP subunit